MLHDRNVSRYGVKRHLGLQICTFGRNDGAPGYVKLVRVTDNGGRMKALGLAGIVILAFLAACTDSSEPSPSPTRTPTQTATSSPSPTPTTSPVASQIVYTVSDRDTSDRSRWGDIYLYDVASDRVTRLTSDGERVAERQPRFRGSTVNFIAGDGDLIELNPANGRRRRITRVGGTIATYAWSPDGDEVAYIEVLDSGAHRLRVRNVASGETRTLKNLGTVDGRGTSDLDTVTVAWSKAGDRLLVNDTYLDAIHVRLVRRQDGRDLITPVRNASQAVWSTDESSIYLLNASATGSGGDGTWQSLDIATQQRRRLSLAPGSFHPALSPDGTKLAATTFDREKNAHAVYVLDLRSGTQTRVAKGYRDAVWLDGQTIALTRVVACSTGSACEYYGYRASGTRAITLSREVSPIALGSTLWDGGGKPNADLRYS